MYISLYKALGSDPQAMNFAEVFTSLTTKGHRMDKKIQQI